MIRLIRHLYNYKIAIIFFVFLSAQPAVAQNVCGPFSFPRIPADSFDSLFFTQYRDAFLQINLEDSQGTGFIIDSGRGYVLTARHVVRLAVSDKTKAIYAFSQRFPEEKLTLRLRDNTDPELDIAVLQLAPPDKLSAAPSLQINLAPPARGSTVHYAGFPFKKRTLVPGRANIFEMDDKLKLTVRGATVQGDSGSPVLDEHGLVMGMVTDQQTEQLGEFVSSLALEPLLMKLDPSLLADSLLKTVLSSTPRNELMVKFFPNASKDSWTNLDLLGLIKLINKKVNLTQTQKENVLCPVYYSAIDRGLRDQTRYITHQLPLYVQADVARNNFVTAKMYSGIRKLDKAMELLAEAQEQLAQASTAHIKRKPTPLVEVACTLAEKGQTSSEVMQVTQQILKSGGLPSDISITLTDEQRAGKCRQPQSDEVLSAYLRDLALIKLELAQLSEEKVRAYQMRSATSLATLATILSGDTQLYAANLALLGDLARKNNDFEFAAGAYAGAYQKGKTAGWVKTNFKESMSKLTNETVSIDSAEAIPRSALYEKLMLELPAM